jgi:hypothetical protein
MDSYLVLPNESVGADKPVSLRDDEELYVIVPLPGPCPIQGRKRRERPNNKAQQVDRKAA